MIGDRDRQLLEAIDDVGPVTPHALAYHSIVDRFEGDDDLAVSLQELADVGHLRTRTVVDVAGEPVTEYETAAE